MPGPRRAPRSPSRLARVRPTTRGTAVLAASVALVAAGTALGLADLVALGAAGLLVVGGAWAWMVLRRIDRGRGALRVSRRVEPDPAVRGHQVTTRLLVSPVSPTATALARLARLQISEQAAAELCEHDALRAQVVSHPDRIAVRYRLRPEHRGRWPLGPVLTSRVDVFGLVRAAQPLGERSMVSVRPRTTELATRGSRAFGDLARSANGARTSSSDDSILREYVSGDDPRRVHWATAARRGQLMVRTDENAGVPPVTVLLDRGVLPPPDTDRSSRAAQDGEWAVEAAASVAVTLLGAGHPARLVASTAAPALEAYPYSTGRGSDGAAQILDDTIDLEGHASPRDAERALAATADALRASRRPGELTFAVIGPLGPLSGPSLVPLAGDGNHWAFVVAPAHDDRDAAVQDTLTRLRTIGWHAVAVDPRSTTITDAWNRLMEEHR
ncbi:DUF58 domain-containing protein [Oerskovia paurometabola]|uniref:DUF58 domain-containing protein n=1 Tax=Oerskovia paurometabola TaxID=162170 RepID=A0ABW1XDU3_9CELL|nr:DUF58 domain-containing protein [Oerskovia paurometabola]MBM7497053.1 uncharacterized protein (DUF58 family) [Oerskovia paurometabola]